MSKTKYFYLYIILLFKSYLFWPNDPDQNQYCFKYYYPEENEEGEILNFDSCKKKEEIISMQKLRLKMAL